MRRHLSNALYGALDYVSYPLGMLVVAPVVIHRLDASEYGLWMITTAMISAGGIIASGFCDAATQHIARLRAGGQHDRMAKTIQSTLAIGLVLGLVLACMSWSAAPFAAPRIAVPHGTSARECVFCLRIAGLLIVARSIESVGVSVHRAFDSYGSTVRISACMRLLTLFTAAGLALCGLRTTSFLLATGVFLTAGAYLQLRTLRRFLRPLSFWPSFQGSETRILIGLGLFVWLQALGSVAFAQFDRILLGVSLGAAVVAPYALCVQLTHPLSGFTASALHFLFPYLSGRADTISRRQLRRTVLYAFACNVAFITVSAAALLLFAGRLLRLLAGASIANTAAQILPNIVLGSALVGVSVTGVYALQALGRFRVVAITGLGSRAAMLVLMLVLLHRHGLQGLALARLFYGGAALLVYVPLARLLSARQHPSASAVFPMPFPQTGGTTL